MHGGDGGAPQLDRSSPRDIDPARARALIEVFAGLPDIALVVDNDLRVIAQSAALGATEHEMTFGHAITELVHPSCAEPLRNALSVVRDGGRARTIDVFTAPSSWWQLSLGRIERDGFCEGLVVVATDISERKESEDRLRRAEAMMVDTQGTAHLGTWDWDVSQPHAVWSDELFRIYGLTPQQYTPSYEAYLQMVHPDDREHVKAATERVFREHLPYSHDERVILRDGSMRYLHTWAHAIVDADRKLTRLVGVCQDITDRKSAEIALEQRVSELARANERLRREIAEREEVEKQLRQVQKLEAIGRLAGGIAHDFNNLMGVVIGYGSMMQSRMAPDDPLRRYLSEIMKSGDSAARMTRQLLAFSREQVIERSPLDPNAVISAMSQMLTQVLGEKIEVRFSIDEDIPLIEANRSQLEQVLVNLVVNARDAMPEGGALDVSTGVRRITEENRSRLEIDPGEYVVLVVRDDGVGMNDEVMARIFDPFFTTKESGKGTGLGLSTVFAIVKQSSGAVTVVSSPGKGAEFTVWFPAIDVERIAERETMRHGPPRGTETILLVEDQGALRNVVRESLEACGYRVIDATDPSEAQRRSADFEEPIDLLLTDVVMPRMSGRELAERLVRERPSLRVLFMSGYANDVALREGVSDRTIAFLPKPFTPHQLAERVRTVLDSPLAPEVDQ